MSNLSRLLRSALPAVLLASSLAVNPSLPSAHAATVQQPYAIGVDHAKSVPYSFTGRIFILDDGSFGTGTLVRRHTVLTAGHVVYDETLGFIQNATFTRALYEDFSLSRDQIISVTAFSGYQASATLNGADSLAAFALDQGYALLRDAPVDENWGNYIVQPTLLSLSTTKTFVLGYPSTPFDGITMAYIVPTTTFTPIGTSTTTASYENDGYYAIGGMSGGPIYVVTDGVNQLIAATTVGGSLDTTAGANASFVRAIDKPASKAIVAAEYTGGLIKNLKVTGPKTVVRGQTYTYTVTPIFTVPTLAGAKATTERYNEIKLLSNNAGVPTNPAIVIVKTSNTTFNVTFTSAARSGNIATLQAAYTKTAVGPGKSSISVLIK